MLIQDNINTKELKILVDKLINLSYLQAKEIDILQFKVLLKLEHKIDKARELLEISKNIPLELKEILKKEIDNYAKRQPDGLLQTSEEEKEEEVSGSQTKKW